MILSTTTAILGATLGTLSGILTLCWLSCFCKSCRKAHLDKGTELDPEKAKPSVLHSAQQFSVKKSTEPIQPRLLLKFPKIYRPKPSVTSSEVINYPAHTLETVDKPCAEPPAGTAEHGCGSLATDGAEEVFIIPKQDPSEDTPCATELNHNLSSSHSSVRPKLHFSLTYHGQRKELHVTVIEAENVSAEPGSEGYVLGLLTTTVGRKEARTSTRRLTACVRWAESLVFPLPEGCQEEEGEVALSLYSCDRFSQHCNLGDMRFKMADVEMMSGAGCWVDLQPPKQDASTFSGELLLSISYLPAANRLGVVVMKARGLHSDKLKDTIDLSVKLTLKHQSSKLKKKQTRRVKHKMNPVWNEMMMLEVPRELLAQSSLELEVLNQSNPGHLNALGRCQLGLQSSSTGLQHWQQMLDNPRKQIAMWHPIFI